MKIPLFLAAAAVVTPLMADTYVVADFEKGTDGFSDTVQRETGGAKEGQGAGKIAGDFTNVTQSAWTTASKPLDVANPVQGASFWVKTSDAKQLTVRLTDTTGQVFQVRPVIEPNGEWQKVNVDSFESGPGFQSYGGAKDKKVHWPAKAFGLILEKNGFVEGKTAGVVLVDQIEFQVEGSPRSAARAALEEKSAGAAKVVIGDFEDGLGKFTGSIEQDPEQAKVGKASGRIAADFSQGPGWTSATVKLDAADAVRVLRFFVKSKEAKGIAVRLTDATGQSHMVRPGFKPGEEWQEVVISDFTTGPGHQSYGGDNDGKVHWPAKSLSFVVEKGRVAGGAQATVWLDGVEIYHGSEQ